jgi:hypothetical protein
MAMDTMAVSVSKPVAKALRELTCESNLDLAALKLLKELLKFKIQAEMKTIRKFEKKYRMSFSDFEQACLDGRIKDPYSYEVESDDFDWGAAVTDYESFVDMQKKLEANYPSPPTIIVFSRSQYDQWPN